MSEPTPNPASSTLPPGEAPSHLSSEKEVTILDVHPPHEAAHSWKDFLIHIVTIVIGLLIAIGLEQTVEYFHHRHLLHQAEENLRSEIQDNRQTLAEDEKQLTGTEQEMENNLVLLADLKAHRPSTRKWALNWQWDGLQSAAWDTARNTGAIALMSYETAQDYSVIYSQQALVNDQAWIYIRGIYKDGRSIATHKLEDLQPEEIDESIADTKQTLTDIRYLKDLIVSLNKIYQREEVATTL